MSGLCKKISVISIIFLIFIICVGTISAEDSSDVGNDTLNETFNVKTYTDLQEIINSTEDGSEIELMKVTGMIQVLTMNHLSTEFPFQKILLLQV